jgi:F-type H+-transporting ATPase subunit alpha
MEARIRRGRALREALKQDRLVPLPIEFQMAWLVAYNEGLLEDENPKRVPQKLRALAEGLARQPLTLDDARADWVAAVKSWLQVLPA